MHEAMELKVLNTGGTETGEVVTLRDDIFGAEISEHAMYLTSRKRVVRLEVEAESHCVRKVQVMHVRAPVVHHSI